MNLRLSHLINFQVYKSLMPYKGESERNHCEEKILFYQFICKQQIKKNLGKMVSNFCKFTDSFGVPLNFNKSKLKPCTFRMRHRSLILLELERILYAQQCSKPTAVFTGCESRVKLNFWSWLIKVYFLTPWSAYGNCAQRPCELCQSE